MVIKLVIISLLLIIFNIWKVIRKLKISAFSPTTLFRDIQFNLMAIATGLYFIFMIFELDILLKILTLVIGLLFIIYGFLNVKDDVEIFTKHSGFERVVISGGILYSIFVIMIGVLLITLFAATIQ